MMTPISGNIAAAATVQPVAPQAPAAPAATASSASNRATAPDTVTISSAGQAAHASSDGDSDAS